MVLEPGLYWEGVGMSVEPSVRGEINRLVRQLRDPCVYEEEGRTFLLYCGGGESAIGIAEVAGVSLSPARSGLRDPIGGRGEFVRSPCEQPARGRAEAVIAIEAVMPR